MRKKRRRVRPKHREGRFEKNENNISSKEENENKMSLNEENEKNVKDQELNQ